MSNGELRISLPIHTVCWIVEKDNLIGMVPIEKNLTISLKQKEKDVLVTSIKNMIPSIKRT